MDLVSPLFLLYIILLLTYNGRRCSQSLSTKPAAGKYSSNHHQQQQQGTSSSSADQTSSSQQLRLGYVPMTMMGRASSSCSNDAQLAATYCWVANAAAASSPHPPPANAAYCLSPQSTKSSFGIINSTTVINGSTAGINNNNSNSTIIGANQFAQHAAQMVILPDDGSPSLMLSQEFQCLSSKACSAAAAQQRNKMMTGTLKKGDETYSYI
jgi:hypothetical protein